MEKMHTVKSAAEHLGGMSVWTLYSLIKAGRLQVSKVGRKYLVSESELRRLIDAADAGCGVRYDKTMP